MPDAAGGKITLPLSPHKIYHIAADDKAMPECDQVKCSVEYEFQWFYEDDCQAVVVCSKMTGNTCGCHGLNVHINNRRPLCFENVALSENVTFMSKPSLELWYLDSSKFEAECFFWCSEDGNVPEKLEKEEVNETLIHELVSSTSVIEEVDLVTTTNVSTVTPLSSRIVYHIKENLGDAYCLQDKCVMQHQFKWLREGNCSFKLICSKLTGHVCGNYGVDLDFSNGAESSVCQQGQFYGHAMVSREEVTVSVWHAGVMENNEVACYFWCTEDGQVPVREATHVMDPAVIEVFVISSSV